MEQFYALDSVFRFNWLSPPHLSALAAIISLNALIYLVRTRLTQPARTYLRLALAILLILQEVLLQLWELGAGIWSVDNSLPLQLCSLSLILTSLMLLTRSAGLYQVVYFWGVAGATQALLTPDIYYGFPHFAFLQFFTAHGLIVTGCLWMTFVEGCRPSFSSLGKAFLVTNLYAALVAVFNSLTGSNYLYLCQKPANPSLLDYLGVWPWYILSLEGLALTMFFLSVLPFQGAELPLLGKRKFLKRSVQQ